MKNSIFRYIKHSSKSLPLRGRFRVAHALCTMNSALCTLVLALIFLTGCITDDIGPCTEGVNQIRQDYYYITLNVVNPQAATSRSVTTPTGESENGRLDATQSEKDFVSANIYFCNSDYHVLAEFESEYVAPVADDGTTTIRIKVNSFDQLKNLVGQENIKVLIAGNYKKDSSTALYTPSIPPTEGKADLTKATFPISGVAADPIGDYGDAGHLMPIVSAEAFTIDEIEAEEEGVKTAEDIVKGLFKRLTPTNAWWDVNSDPIKMERAVARIEFRGKITKKEAPAEGFEETFRYDVDGINGLKMDLVALAPFNVNKESYLFRHGSEGTDDAYKKESLEMFLVENGKSDGNDGSEVFNGYNWIASPWWEARSQELLNPFSVDENSYLINGVKMTPTTPGYKTITELFDRTPSTDLVVTQVGNEQGGYHPWWYVSENTLYSKEIMKDGEAEKNATGIAFMFEVIGSDGQAVSTKANNLTSVMSWSKEPDKEGWLEIMNSDNGDWIEIEPQGDHYYVTYMALIRHNASKSSDAVLPMYYGVVRNNTYQVSIGKLNGLPNPREPKQLYLDLQINILNWTKRDVGYDF